MPCPGALQRTCELKPLRYSVFLRAIGAVTLKTNSGIQEEMPRTGTAPATGVRSMSSVKEAKAQMMAGPLVSSTGRGGHLLPTSEKLLDVCWSPSVRKLEARLSRNLSDGDSDGLPCTDVGEAKASRALRDVGLQFGDIRNASAQGVQPHHAVLLAKLDDVALTDHQGRCSRCSSLWRPRCAAKGLREGSRHDGRRSKAPAAWFVSQASRAESGAAKSPHRPFDRRLHMSCRLLPKGAPHPGWRW